MKLMKFQVKNKKKNSSLLIKYREVMREVAELILSRLQYTRPLFEAKLLKTNVIFIPTEEESSGALEIDYNKNLIRITIKINESNSINFIRLIMAHELYHLLYASISPVAAMGYNFTDSSYQVNSIIRRNSTGEYGTQLNEQIANVLAYETISKNNMLPEEDRDISLWNDFTNFYNTFLSPIKELISAFNTKNGRGWNLEEGYEFDGKFIPENIFLYGSVNGNSEMFVRTYEKIMGEYSWQRLNKMIDVFYIGNASKGIKPFDKEFYLAIMGEINRFNMLSNLKRA